MRLVIIESPYGGENKHQNIQYVHAALADCLARGEAPFASHALYTLPGVLDDELPLERMQGIVAGFAWGDRADATVVYTDQGISAGMLQGIARALALGRPIEYRSLPGIWTAKCGCGWKARPEGHWSLKGANAALDSHLADCESTNA